MITVLLYFIGCAAVGGGFAAAYLLLVHPPVTIAGVVLGALIGLVLGFLAEEMIGRR